MLHCSLLRRNSLLGTCLFMLVLLSTCAANRYVEYGKEVAIESLRMPDPVMFGGTAKLECHWRVGQRGFNALRWFKDDKEIYLYNNGESQGVDHHIPGVNIVLSMSDENVLTLSNVTHEAQGNYKCEIMSEGPPFTLANSEKMLIVVELPDTLQFLGLRDKYYEGDTLNVTCIATNGRPPPELNIKINDGPVRGGIGRLKQLPIREALTPGLFEVRLQLILTLSQSDMPTLKLGCYSVTHGHQVENEFHIQVHQRSPLSFFFYPNGDIALTPASTTCIILLVCFLL